MESRAWALLGHRRARPVWQWQQPRGKGQHSSPTSLGKASTLFRLKRAKEGMPAYIHTCVHTGNEWRVDPTAASEELAIRWRRRHLSIHYPQRHSCAPLCPESGPVLRAVSSAGTFFPHHATVFSRQHLPMLL